MNINCNAWNPSMQKAMRLARWLVLEHYNEPLNAADHAIDSVIAALKAEGCNPDATTAITIPLDEYRLLISDAQRKAKEEGCKEGREEAWDLARRIAAWGSDCYTYEEVCDLFDTRSTVRVLNTPVEEVLAKDKKFQEEKKTLHVGDEVEFTDHGIAKKGYVVNLIALGVVRVLTKDLGTYAVTLKECKKTGRHSDEIEKAMTSFEKGGNET